MRHPDTSPASTNPQPEPAPHTGDPAVPSGFAPFHTVTGGFISLIGPVHVREVPGAPPVIGLRIAPQHLNLRGIPHGGLLATLADTALGHAINHARGGPLSIVTVSLSTDFLAAARLGDWVEAHVEIERLGQRMAFASCRLRAGERVLLRASGTFAVIGPA
jgi:uncharacterized protein (TIGR00369 family)